MRPLQVILLNISEGGRKLMNYNRHNALIGAFAASLCVRAFEFSIFVLGDHEISLHREIKFTLIAIASYLTATLLLYQLWARMLKRMLPVWLLIAFGGSLLYESTVLVPTLIYLWNDPYRVEPNSFRLFLTEFEFTRTTFTLNFIIAMLVMPVLHYIEPITEAIKSWHNGTQDTLSILSKPKLKK